MRHTTVTLIGMPGSGKSTVGVLLAKRLGLNFVDSDLLIQVQEGETLQETVESRGYLVLRAIEQDILLSMPLDDSLVATGGSVVYSDAGMQRLCTAGPVVYLDVPMVELEARIALNPDRGIACPPGQSFADVYRERTPLYRKYADITVAGDQASAEETATLIVSRLAAN